MTDIFLGFLLMEDKHLLSYVVITMAADALVMQGAGASAGMILI